MSRRAFNQVVMKAQRDAFDIVKREIKANLPKGWTVHFAVGWGFCVMDDAGQTVVGGYTEPGKLTQRQRRTLEIAADYADIFGYDNSFVRV